MVKELQMLCGHHRLRNEERTVLLMKFSLSNYIKDENNHRATMVKVRVPPSVIQIYKIFEAFLINFWQGLVYDVRTFYAQNGGDFYIPMFA